MVDAAADNRSQNTPQKRKNDMLRLPVDREHSGIRAAGCVTLLAAAALLFMVLETFLLNMPVLSLLLSLAGSAALSYGLEHYLRGRWPSGRELVLSDERVALLNQDDVERQVNPQNHVNVLAWYFEVKRTSRVKKGWYVVSFGLEQNDNVIPAYTFMPPDEFENLDFEHYFTQLEREDKRKKKTERTTASGMRRAGQQRRLYEAEVERGMIGAELTREQFVQYVRHLQDNFSDWMPDV